MLLYDYFRSSAAFRVRIALAIKGISVERRFVHLLKDGGMHKKAEYRERNPQALVPALELDNGVTLTQSLAIIEYLEALQPLPRLAPSDPILAAKARGVALAIACDIHPLGNLRVLSYLRDELQQSEQAIAEWRSRWVQEGLAAVEQLIQPAPFCFGTQPTIADVCLAPQLFYAARFAIPLQAFPKVRAAGAACEAHPAFRAAHPSAQPDAE
ncbi:maleylacetoacetate isomerase [Methylocystis sp. MJC1]|jgi:maleylacetoacetate isomerase|uniref:maleylacetoacetate isomerase n=1 Tax=Methylocystis sp. MJC1 TaxID=2654282 RepID=UPI0013ED3938|nr:maleylacetoacetate isomerase [Methylocystis sp. MJC1]KAF2989846.1 Maleylpyruvate isomerase [Methylocystis sp. MJC1]MBU6528387.1 maleylacetoacetate isomerase [Methylocystis sp. MJC1]UZX11289.1 maleylacetoacetate isomerase [Methylocystis sp. MJC1]